MSEVADALSGVAPAPSPSPAPAPSPSPAPSPTPAPSPSPAPPPAEGDGWQAKFLSPDLAADPFFANYKTLDDFAKGAQQTASWARGRVAIPKADDAAGFAEFAAKVRPETADGYAFTGADGKPIEIDPTYRDKAFELGLHPMQAKALLDWDTQRNSDAISRATQQGKDELTAIELELGPQGYNQRLSAVEAMLRGAGIEDPGDIATALEQTHGAGKAMTALFKLAEATGELAKVDGATVQMRMGSMTREGAQAIIDEMAANKDPAFQAKLADKSSAEYGKRQAALAVLRQPRK